jgi:hypothetical protein
VARILTVNCHRIVNSQRSVSVELADPLRRPLAKSQDVNLTANPTGDSSSLVFTLSVCRRSECPHQLQLSRSPPVSSHSLYDRPCRARLLEVPLGLLANAVRGLACVAAFPGPELSIVNPTRKMKVFTTEPISDRGIAVPNKQ